MPFFELLNPDGTKNYFAIDNFIDESIVKSYYCSKESIKEAYAQNPMFNVCWQYKYLLLGDIEKLKRERNMTMKENHKEIIRQLELLDGYETETVQRYRDDLYKCNPFIVEAYESIGKNTIEALNYSRPKIKEAMILKQYKEKTTGLEFFQLLDIHFQVGNRYTKKYINETLKHIFSTLKITPREAVSSESINDFFEATPYRSGNNVGYILIRKK